MTDVAQLKTLEAANDAAKPDGEWSGKPAVPASGVAQANNSGVPMWIRIFGGTVTDVAVDGVTIAGMVTAGLANGDWIRLRAGSTVAITYSAAPTWQWFEE